MLSNFPAERIMNFFTENGVEKEVALRRMAQMEEFQEGMAEGAGFDTPLPILEGFFVEFDIEAEVVLEFCIEILPFFCFA